MSKLLKTDKDRDDLHWYIFWSVILGAALVLIFGAYLL